MVDRLAALLSHFSVSAHTFHTGVLCGSNALSCREPYGQLHLIREGQVQVRHGARTALRITEPSLLLYPRPMAHRFITDKTQGANFVCADVSFEGGPTNPIVEALPAVVCMPLAQMPRCEPTLQSLFDEAGASHCGRQAVLDRLFEVVVIQVLRELMEQRQLEVGLLAGLAHERLRRALVAMHQAPEREWSLELLAEQAGMSRTSFATCFRDTVGQTPAAYLQRWRIGLAQQLLRKGQALKLIASQVGYGTEAALSRAFRSQTGSSPREWRKAL